MNINKNENSCISFGWYFRLHGNITRKIGEKLNLDKISLKKITSAVQKPDWDEILLFRQKHFYFPLSQKSFLDFSKTRNAKCSYLNHINNMQNLIKSNKDKSLNEAGRALHYLQDMTQPHHIEEGSFFKKLINSIHPHGTFEIYINHLQENLYKNSVPIKLKSSNFQDLFEETLKLSQKNYIPKSFNEKDWANIGQNSLNILMGVTNKFLELLNNYKLK